MYTTTMLENNMKERCPARAFEEKPWEDMIWHSSIPEECLKCLARARREGTAIEIHVSRYDVIVESIQKEEPNFDPINADKWSSEGMKIPHEGDERRVFVASSGFDDSLGDSYSLETDTITSHFTCEK